jgi:hypothetical protein
MKHELPEGFTRGVVQGRNVIGDITETLHRWILDGWGDQGAPPRVEEDLSFVPKDREEVIYVYMYRVAQNTNLLNSKRFREARVQPAMAEENGDGGPVLLERAPLFLDLFYLVCVHSKFRSDSERLLGWLMMRLHEATHLVYRPRRFVLPDGREVDSTGRMWSPIAEPDDDVIMEKVAVALVDDLTFGDAINFFTIHESPYRPYLTYRARCAMDGALIQAPSATLIRPKPIVPVDPAGRSGERPSGRLGSSRPRGKE